MIRKIFLMVLFAFSVFVLNAQDPSLTVIANSKGAPAELKFAELKSILKGEKQRWPDGTKILICLMKTNTAAGTTTSRKVYNMSGDDVNKFWLALVFQGKAPAPSFFNSMSELETFVAQNSGAIGVVTQTTGTEAKTISIDGKKTF